MRVGLVFGALMVSACSVSAPLPPPAIGPAQIPQSVDRDTALRLFKPSAIIRYGNEAGSQRVELFLPEGRGPFPVVAFIHGGCYTTKEGGLEDMRETYSLIARSGIAVWGIGYRRTDEPGGAYPGMYRDIAAATDLLVRNARRYRVDLSHAVIAGNSAGGQLALWVAGRANISEASPLFGKPRFRPRGVVAIAGPGMLAPLEAVADQLCGPGVFEGVVGPKGPRRYFDTSPDHLFPYRIPIRLLVGDKDDVVPPALVEAFAAAARAYGEDVQMTVIPNAYHVDPVRPDRPALQVTVDAIRSAAGLDRATAAR